MTALQTTVNTLLQVNGMIISDLKVHAELFKPRTERLKNIKFTNVYVKYIPSSWSDELIEHIFHDQTGGEVKLYKVWREEYGISACLSFVNPEKAKIAVKKLNGKGMKKEYYIQENETSKQALDKLNDAAVECEDWFKKYDPEVDPPLEPQLDADGRQENKASNDDDEEEDKNDDNDVIDNVMDNYVTTSGGVNQVKAITDDSGEVKLGGLISDAQFELNGLYVARLMTKKERKYFLEKKKISKPWQSRKGKYPKTNVYVEGLSEDVNDKKLQSMFEKFGTVISARVMIEKDGKSKGYGFVAFNKIHQAQRAIRGMKNTLHHGQPLIVYQALTKAQREKLKWKLRNKDSHRYNQQNGDMVQQQQNHHKPVRNQGYGGSYNRQYKQNGYVVQQHQNHHNAPPHFRNQSQYGAQFPAQHMQPIPHQGNHGLYNNKNQNMNTIPQQFSQHPNPMLPSAPIPHVPPPFFRPPPMNTNNHMRGIGSNIPMPSMSNYNGTQHMPVLPQQIPAQRPAQMVPQAGVIQHITGNSLGVSSQNQTSRRISNPNIPPQVNYNNGNAGPAVSQPHQSSVQVRPQSVPQISNGIPSAATINQTSRMSNPNNPPQSNHNNGITNPTVSQPRQSSVPVAPQSIPQSSGVASTPIESTVTAEMLADAKPAEKKRLLGEALFPKIQVVEPILAGKITGMLLEMDNTEILTLLSENNALRNKINEALAVLKDHQQKLSVSQSKPNDQEEHKSPVASQCNPPNCAEFSDEDKSKLVKLKELKQKIRQLIPTLNIELNDKDSENMINKIDDELCDMDNVELAELLEETEKLRSKVVEIVSKKKTEDDEHMSDLD